MLRILTRSVSEGYTPGPSLTLRVSMTFFVAGVIRSPLTSSILSKATAKTMPFGYEQKHAVGRFGWYLLGLLLIPSRIHHLLGTQ